MKFDGEWLFTGFLLGVVFCWMLMTISACASDPSNRKSPHECGGTYHEECWNYTSHTEARDCEYEYYKECIDGK